MDFNNWLDKKIADEPNLGLFITKLKPLFTENGFNGAEFEKKVKAGLTECDSKIEELLKGESYVEN